MQVQACFYGANTNQALLILAYADVEICGVLDASGFRMAQSPGRFRSENSRENSRENSWNIQ